jgi:hypothetical protein
MFLQSAGSLTRTAAFPFTDELDRGPLSLKNEDSHRELDGYFYAGRTGGSSEIPAPQ